jgi:uncharacterized protein YjgD (DUF1641 family)
MNNDTEITWRLKVKTQEKEIEALKEQNKELSEFYKKELERKENIRKTKGEQKEAKLEKHKEKILELYQKGEKINKVSPLAKILGISRVTFYNLKLNEYTNDLLNKQLNSLDTLEELMDLFKEKEVESLVSFIEQNYKEIKGDKIIIEFKKIKKHYKTKTPRDFLIMLYENYDEQLKTYLKTENGSTMVFISVSSVGYDYAAIYSFYIAEFIRLKRGY